MGNIQIPPDSTGKLVDTTIVGGQHRENIVIADPTLSGGVAPVTTSGGLLVSMPGPVAPVTTSYGVLVLISTASGSFSSQVLITGTSGGIAPVTTSGGIGVTILSGSGSGSTAVNIVGSSNGIGPATTSGGLLVAISNLLAPVTTSYGVGVNILSGAGAGSTVVNLGTYSGASGAPVTSSGGLLVTVFGGGGSTAVNVVGTSNGQAPITTSGGLSVNITNALAPVTTSYGVGVNILNGSGAGSTTINIVGTSGGVAPVTTSGGVGVTILAGSGAGSTVVSLSSTPTVFTASSGMVSLAAWSSDQGARSGISAASYVSSSSGNSVNVKSSAATFFGFYAFNSTQSMRWLKVYNTSSAPTVGSTAGQVGNYGIPYSTGGAGAQHLLNPFGVYNSAGLGFTIVSGPESTSTGVIGANDISLTMYSL